jgi:hypothetical protein
MVSGRSPTTAKRSLQFFITRLPSPAIFLLRMSIESRPGNPARFRPGGLFMFQADSAPSSMHRLLRRVRNAPGSKPKLFQSGGQQPRFSPIGLGYEPRDG